MAQDESLQDDNQPFNTPSGASQPAPAAAADAGGVATSPSTADLLTQLAHGDQGAKDVATLRAADQRSAPPIAPAAPAPTPGAPPAPAAGAPATPTFAPGIESLVGPGGLAALTGGGAAPTNPIPNVNPLGAGLLGFGTNNPMAGEDLYRKRLTSNLAVIREQRQNEAEFYTQFPKLAFDTLFPGQPAAALAWLKGEAEKRGITMSDALVAKAYQMKKDYGLSDTDFMKAWDGANVGEHMRLDDVHKKIIAAHQGEQVLREATTKANVAQEKGPEEIAQARLKTINELRQSQQTPNESQINALFAAGEVPTKITDPRTGAQYFSPRKFQRDETGEPIMQDGDIDVRKLHQLDAAKTAATAQARQDATVTTSTKQMMESARFVQNRVQAVREDLAKVAGSNWQGDPRAQVLIKAQQPTAEEQSAISVGANEHATHEEQVAAERAISGIEARVRSARSKVGFTDAPFVAYLYDAHLLATQIMRMHVGARGGAYMLPFFDIGAGTQPSGNVNAVLDRIDKYAGDTAKGTNMRSYNFDTAYGGGAAKAPGAPQPAGPPPKDVADLDAAVAAGQ